MLDELERKKMMWQVFWNQSAENELADIWLAAADKQAVTDAANQTDQLLRSDPLSAGESRQENFGSSSSCRSSSNTKSSRPPSKVRIV